MAGRAHPAHELPRDLAPRLAAGDREARCELVAARAGAVHAYATAAGMGEGRAAFVAAVLASVGEAADVDERLLAVARGMSNAGGSKVARRRLRRAERSFHAACAAAVPVRVARAALRGLDAHAPQAPGAQSAPAADAASWVPAALLAAPRPAGAAGAVAGAAGAARPAGPADWLPAALRGVNGFATAAPPARNGATPAGGEAS